MSEEGYKHKGEIEKERIYETKSLLDNGSEFVVDEDGKMRLNVSGDRITKAKMEMLVDLAEKIPSEYPEWKKFIDKYKEKDNDQLFKELYDISYMIYMLHHDMAHGKLDNIPDEEGLVGTLHGQYYAIVAILENRNNWRTEEFVTRLKEAVNKIRATKE
jgi:hypothetical protein